jgi:GDP-mannose 6-dehydrogenase
MNIFFQDVKLNISKAYLLPGFAFGGSCLPKDVRAIRASAKTKNLNTPIFDALLNANDEQVMRAFNMIKQSGKTKIAMMGLSFKAGTDDLRESPLVTLADKLLDAGYDLKIYDPNVFEASTMDGANQKYIVEGIPHIHKCLVENADQVTGWADIFVIGNGNEDFATILNSANDNAAILDLVRLKDKSLEEKENYSGICW